MEAEKRTLEKKNILWGTVAIALALAGLVFLAVGITPIVIAQNIKDYVPTIVRRELYKEVTITDEMRIPPEMIRAVFALPEEERYNLEESFVSDELAAVEELFKRQSKSRPGFDNWLAGTSDEHWMPFLMADVENATDEHRAYIWFGLIIKPSWSLGDSFVTDADEIITQYWFYEDGTILVYSIWSYQGVSYAVRNYNNEGVVFWKENDMKSEVGEVRILDDFSVITGR